MDNKTYYEKFDWEEKNLKERLKEKVKLIRDSIPEDVQTIADIGCGDGAISNELNKEFKVFAVDRSKNALKYVTSTKINASANYLPLENNSVDLVFSSEMLEHLPDEIFTSAIKEMKRVSRKYIFLTFPNNENIEKKVTMCPNCKTAFNISYHLRTLNAKIIEELFPEYRIVKSFEYGLKVRDYKRFLSTLKHKLTPPTAWIPPMWTKGSSRKTMCPKCGHEFEIPYKFNLLAFLIDSFNVLISPKRPYQICLLLEKK